MKFSFMTFSTPKLSFDEILDACQNYGYDGIEPRIVAGHAHGIELTATKEYLRECKAKAEAKGIGGHVVRLRFQCRRENNI